MNILIIFYVCDFNNNNNNWVSGLYSCFRTVQWRRNASLPRPPPSPPPSPSPPVPSASISPTPPPSLRPPRALREEVCSVWGGGLPWRWSSTAGPAALPPALLLLPRPLLLLPCPRGLKVSSDSFRLAFFFIVTSVMFPDISLEKHCHSSPLCFTCWCLIEATFYCRNVSIRTNKSLSLVKDKAQLVERVGGGSKPGSNTCRVSLDKTLYPHCL